MAVESIEITRPGTPPVTSGGCGCCSPAAPPQQQAILPSAGAQVTAVYQVDGMTCGHCAGTVTSAVQGIPGVTDVLVDLTPGGLSTVTVTSTGPVSAEDVDTAVREAGYRLA